MFRTTFSAALLGAVIAVSQSAPAFTAAVLHVSAPNTPRELIGVFPQNDRYELRAATMVDMIGRAWDVNADKIVGGPNWLSIDRFDLLASFPERSNPDTLRSMLQALLADRFKLVVHNDTRPLPAYAMTVAKSGVKMKKSDESGDPECKSPDTSGAAAQSGPIYTTYICHKVTMAEFADWAPIQAPAYFSGLTLVDHTNLNGAWDFTIKWSSRGQLDLPEAMTFLDGAEKLLGLKIDPVKIPLPVIVVDSVNEKPTDNDPEAVKALAGPAEFEIAVVRPSAPDSQRQSTRFLPGGRYEVHHITLKALIQRAWDIQDDSKLIGAPSFIDKKYFDITAQAAAHGATSNLSVTSIEVMIRNLLKDRFRLAVHNEERPGDVFALIAAKPKLTKADPSNRAECKGVASTTNPVRRTIACTNTTMAQLADQLPRLAGGYFPGGKTALDATGIEGAYDFTLNFSTIAVYNRSISGNASDDTPSATDPNGALSLPEALLQQLGIRMEAQKRPQTVLVVDHVQEDPTEN